jgi:hypothetical protein
MKPKAFLVTLLRVEHWVTTACILADTPQAAKERAESMGHAELGELRFQLTEENTEVVEVQQLSPAFIPALRPELQEFARKHFGGELSSV